MSKQEIIKMLNEYTEKVVIPLIKETCLATQKSIYEVMSVFFDSMKKEVEKKENDKEVLKNE